MFLDVLDDKLMGWKFSSNGMEDGALFVYLNIMNAIANYESRMMMLFCL